MVSLIYCKSHCLCLAMFCLVCNYTDLKVLKKALVTVVAQEYILRTKIT